MFCRAAIFFALQICGVVCVRHCGLQVQRLRQQQQRVVVVSSVMLLFSAWETASQHHEQRLDDPSSSTHTREAEDKSEDNKESGSDAVAGVAVVLVVVCPVQLRPRAQVMHALHAKLSLAFAWRAKTPTPACARDRVVAAF